MFKEIIEAANHAFGVTSELTQATGDIARHEEVIQELRGEVHALSQNVERLTFEIERMRDHAEAERRQAQTEREKLLLQLENAILKMERRLPAGDHSTKG